MKKLLALLLMIISFNSYSQIKYLEIPKCTNYTNHNTYSLLYSEKYKQAIWSAYELIPSDTIIKYKRKSNFQKDNLIKNFTINKNDYKKSGYDRGHLVPARDMRYDSLSIIVVNYYSNISPQLPGFNRGIFRVLEGKISHLTRKYDNIYIVTGPILTDSLPTIGENKISVPNFFYKVIVTYKNGEYKGIGFIIPNKKSKFSLDKYCVSIDFVEAITGLDFFYKLNDKIENIIEKNSNYNTIF